MTTTGRALPRAALAVMALGSAGMAMAQPADPAANMRNAGYLAANCANCHGTEGRSPGRMASLAGMPAPTLAQSVRDFRDGRRPATVMQQLAKGYTDAQIDAIAAYFAAQRAK